MRYFLNLCYLALLLAVSPILLYRMVRHNKYRAGFGEKFLGQVPLRVERKKTCIWFHAVSVGEVGLLEPILREIKKQDPELHCVISTTTRTGMEVAKKKFGERYSLFYCPLDFSWAVANAMRRIAPDLLVLVELELWPQLIAFAQRRGCKVAVVNGRLSENSFRGYSRIRFFLRRLFKKIDLFAVQDSTYAERFKALGASPERLHTTGSIKFDGIETDRDNPSSLHLAKLAGLTETPVFLAGSTQAPEEEYALSAFLAARKVEPDLRLILVPRHPERFSEVAALATQFAEKNSLRFLRRSELDEAIPEDSRGCDILLVDAMGELGAWWGTAKIAFVGGSLGSNRGGQNMLEPAGFGCAISFGPNTTNFREIVAMFQNAEAATVVHSPEELAEFVTRCCSDATYATQLGENARQLVASQQGAAEQTVTLLLRLRD